MRLHTPKAMALATMVAAMTACSHIDEDERLIYVKPEAPKRTVLIEDFTGQRCSNCPLATEQIHALQEMLGDSVVIAVAIHGGPLGFKGNANAIGLTTSEGEEYYNNWGFTYQPIGLVNRHGPLNHTDWADATLQELKNPSPIAITLSNANINEGNAEATVTVTAIDGDCKGMMQAWLLEDGITAIQTMPDGATNRQYVHNHVLRRAINGIWGQEIRTPERETTEISLSCPIEPSWNPDSLSIVAFVYNDRGVLQATKGKLLRQQMHKETEKDEKNQE